MKKFSIFVFGFILTGCAIVTQTSSTSKTSKKELTNIAQAQVGMTYPQVLGVMGPEVIIGYQQVKNQPEVFEPLGIRQPHRTETIKIKDKSYEVLYYFTSIQKEDGIISDDELTPLVFEGSRLVGKGWDFVWKLKNPI